MGARRRQVVANTGQHEKDLKAASAVTQVAGYIRCADQGLGGNPDNGILRIPDRRENVQRLKRTGALAASLRADGVRPGHLPDAEMQKRSTHRFTRTMLGSRSA